MDGDIQIINKANSMIESQLKTRLKKIEGLFNGDALVYIGGILFGTDDEIREAIEAKEGKRSDKLIVILETSGGYIEVAQRIAEIFRHHYAFVEFVIPNFAMSAGTVLVMSGDAIHMDYYSVLGPIDPQVRRPGGAGQVPALGYLEQYQRLIDKADKGKLNTAEMTYLVEKFDPAELYRYEQARDLSISLLREWLVKYKFRNWKRTETRNRPVTDRMRSQRAAQIAKQLNKTDLWHSHSRGIHMAVLVNDLKLVIDDFGSDAEKKKAIGFYYNLLRDYLIKRGHQFVVHTVDGYHGFPE